MSEEQQANILPEEEPNADKMDIENSLIYKVVAGLMASIIPVCVILFFDLYTKSILEYYKVSDVELSYSFDMVMRKIVPNAAVLVAIILCGYRPSQMLIKFFESLNLKSCLTRIIKFSKKWLKCLKDKYSDTASEKTCTSEKRKTKNHTMEKEWIKVIPYIIIFPLVFFWYLFLLSDARVSIYNNDFLKVFYAVITWLIWSMTIWSFLLWLFYEEDKRRYAWVWFLLVPLDFFVSRVSRFVLHMNKNFFSWDDFVMILVVLVAGVAFLFLLALFIEMGKMIWEHSRGILCRFFGQKTNDLQEIQFLFNVICATFGVLLFLLVISQPALYKTSYSVVYEAQENGDVIGVAIYQDDTTMIVLPAKISGPEHDFQYELTGDTNYMYVEKSGVVIEQVSKDKIDWKNHLNIG